MVLRPPDEITMIWAATAQAIMVSIAYIAACAAAALFAAAAVMKLGDVPADPVREFSFFTVFFWSTVFSAIVNGFWPSVIAVAITEGFKLRGIVSHLVAGCIVGLLVALPVRAFLTGAGAAEVSGPVVQLCVASGAVGGFVYWLIAGRTAGRWLSLRLFEENRR